MENPSMEEVQGLTSGDLGIEEDQLHNSPIEVGSLEDSESFVSNSLQSLSSDNTTPTPRGLVNMRDIFASSPSFFAKR